MMSPQWGPTGGVRVELEATDMAKKKKKKKKELPWTLEEPYAASSLGAPAAAAPPAAASRAERRRSARRDAAASRADRKSEGRAGGKGALVTDASSARTIEVTVSQRLFLFAHRPFQQGVGRRGVSRPDCADFA